MDASAVDLRSDTVTKPTEGMRRAMMEAALGDDVLGDDPTVRALEERVAGLLGKEAACYTPSGSMANQSAIRAHTEPGDEIICHVYSHVYQYEGGAPAALSGCSFAFAEGARGQFDASEIDRLIRPDDEHFPRTRLVAVENTMNKGGGSVWALDRFASVCGRARERGLRVHLDGARLWNAAVASGEEPGAYARHADTVSVCFSKGLGAPVGSAVAGDGATIARCRRWRKMFGGAMRQSGLLAGAALYALDHHVERLAEDHRHARLLAEAAAGHAMLEADPDGVESNIVFVEVREGGCDAEEAVRRLEAGGVRALALGPRSVRLVTHLDVDAGAVERACGVIAGVDLS